MTPGAYLSRLATARPLYCLLYREAIGVLPPPLAGACRSDPISCGLTLADLGAKLGLTRSVVGEEMRRLQAHGWVGARKGSQRLLGHRMGAEVALLADVAAEEATGEQGVVSRVVLALSATPAAEVKDAGRGLARRFEL